jgi:hypothetical protein
LIQEKKGELMGSSWKSDGLLPKYSGLAITRHIRFVIDGVRDTDSLLGLKLTPNSPTEKNGTLSRLPPVSGPRKKQRSREDSDFSGERTPQTPFQYEIMAH